MDQIDQFMLQIKQLLNLMSHYESLLNQQSYITHQQFMHFRSEVLQQIQFIKAHQTTHLQQKDVISYIQMQKSQEGGQYKMDIRQLQGEVQQLKGRIVKLQGIISKYEKNRDKCWAQDKCQTLIEQNQRINQIQQLAFQQTYKLMQSSSQFQIQEQEQNIQAPSGNSQKCIIDNRKTNQGANDDQDDEELIQCVWESNTYNKSTILNTQNHHHNPHQQQFTIQRQNNLINITKIKGQGFLSPSHNFVYKESIPLDKVTSFRVKRIKVKDAFFVGIGTVYVFGVQNAFRHKQSISYSSNGDLWMNGDAQKRGKSVKSGQQIEIIVDRVKGQVYWLMNGVQMVRVSLPNSMGRSELYLNLMVFNKDDNLHLYYG